MQLGLSGDQVERSRAVGVLGVEVCGLVCLDLYGSGDLHALRWSLRAFG